MFWGNFKVGQFSLSFLELSVPVSGIPIQLLRNYDSRDTRNTADSIFRNGGSRSLLHLRKSATGYVGSITMGVHRR